VSRTALLFAPPGSPAGHLDGTIIILGGFLQECGCIIDEVVHESFRWVYDGEISRNRLRYSLLTHRFGDVLPKSGRAPPTH
jgi:hypothetical protein